MVRQNSVLLDANLLPVRVLRLARASLWPWWHLRGCRPAGWLLYANDIDGAAIIRQGRRIPLRGGRTVVIPPGVEFHTAPGPDTNQVYCDFDVPGLPPGMPEEPTDLGDDQVLACLSRELHDGLAYGANHRDPALLNLAHGWIRMTLARLLARLPEDRRRQWNEHRADPLDGAVELIEGRLGQPLYIAELAQRCGMGPQWFSKRFRARFGKSPAQYLLDRRVAVAAQRLVHDGAAVDTVAASCGFTDRAHFSKAFARRMGLPPGRYRDEELQRFRAG